MIHTSSDIIRCHKVTLDELRNVLGLGGDVVEIYRNGADLQTVIIITSEVHPEDSRAQRFKGYLPGEGLVYTRDN